MEYIFIIIIIFIIIFLVLNPETPISTGIREKLSPIKEGYNSLVNSTKKYIDASSLKMGTNIPMAQPGKLNADNTQSINHFGALPKDLDIMPGHGGVFKYSRNKYSRNIGCDKTECSDDLIGCDAYTIDEQNRQSPNTDLYAGQNPKTLIPPIITRPSHSLDWRDSALSVPNKINSASNENLYLSGYLSKNDIDRWEEDESMRRVDLKRDGDGDIIENYSPDKSMPEKVRISSVTVPTESNNINPRAVPRDFVENYTKDSPTESTLCKEKSWNSSVNMVNGYNGGQAVRNSFPNNLPQGNCGQHEKLKEYNERLFTNVIQPGTFYKTNVGEQANSNAGISFQQQFLPRTIKEVRGGTLYEDHDPAEVPEFPPIFKLDEPSIDNVYDPRFNGYGDNTRNYVDEVTGQPRFFYDDINNVKMPNYITRNKLDTFNFGSQYGTAEPQGMSLNDVRGKAEAAFLEDSISHRDDLTVRMMRKNNAVMWQRRQAPIRR